MKKDFEVLTYKFPRGRDIKIIPISDIHIGSAESMPYAFKRFCEKVAEEEDTYVILNGDLIDNSIIGSKGDTYRCMSPLECKELLYEALKPIKDKILCITEGNHERRSARNTDTYIGYDIACRLGIEDKYRPNACFVIIRFDDDSKDYRINGKDRPTYTICATHGAGSTFARFERFGYAIDNLDVLVVGHTHKPMIGKRGKLVFDTHNNKVSEKPFHICVAGSWLNYGGYALSAMYQPGNTAMSTINLCSTSKYLSITQA